jgi:DUF4097 and DUF4098 domain-containing protein YvlB
MASPAPNPPMMIPPRRRSLAGPLILILIGVFFLLRTSNLIDRAVLHHWFAHWWPVFLIAWGVIRLIEYYSDTQHGYPARRMGGGSVFLLIIFILIGLSITKTENVNWNRIGENIQLGDDSDWNDFFGGQTFNYTNSVQQALPPNQNLTLRVLSDDGDVTINSWDQADVKVDAVKRIRTTEGKDGNKLDEQTKPTISTEGNVVIVNANTSSAGSDTRVRSDLQVWVPAKMAVDIATRKGDITVRARNGAVKASNSKGSITVEDIQGPVDLEERGRGDIHVARITGTVTINGQVDDSTISDVSGNVKMTGDYYGDMQLSKLPKGFSFKSSRTSLEVAKLDGDLNFNPGDLRASNLAGPVKVLTRSTDMHFDGLSGPIQVENSNGNVEVHSTKMGPIEISNDNGDIRVVVPDKAGFQADVRTGNGDINTDFDSLKIENQNGASKATGSVGNGGPMLKVNDQHGNVELRKSGSSDEG